MKPGEGKILIVDDDPNARDALTLVLGLGGHECLTAHNMESAREAIADLGGLGVRIVLLDGNLSPTSRNGADGIMLNQEIKDRYVDDVSTAGISATDPIPSANIPMVDISSPKAIRAAIESL